MNKLAISFFWVLSFLSTSTFGADKDFELCSIGGLVIQVSTGIMPTTDYKEELQSMPCIKMNDADFLKIFKIISSAQIIEKENYIGHRLLIKAGSFNIYMDGSYIVELNNIHYKIIDLNDRIMLCRTVGQIHHSNLDSKTIEKSCASTE